MKAGILAVILQSQIGVEMTMDMDMAMGIMGIMGMEVCLMEQLV